MEQAYQMIENFSLLCLQISVDLHRQGRDHEALEGERKPS